MKRMIWMGLAVLVLTAGFCHAVERPFFSDVPDNHWAVDAVKKAAHLGLVVGHGDGRFEGDKPPTRYELAMGMSKLLAELENRLKAFPGISNEVLQILERINVHFAAQLDLVKRNQVDIKNAINALYKARGRAMPFTGDKDKK